MEKTLKTTEFKIVDDYSEVLKDSVNNCASQDRKRPKGFVEIYDVQPNGKKKLIGRNNLIVGLG